MEDVRGWTTATRPQTSRAAAMHIQPLPQYSPSPSPLPSQQLYARPALRSSRSAANLRSPTQFDHPPLPPLPPRPAYSPEDFLPPPPPYEVRRVRSSSALSVGAGSTTTEQQNAPSKLKAAFEEAQFRASGLIGKAVESNKHFSVIRHSRGLVWYKGPGTCISITILSDAPLPPNRTVWLQQKGHSGNMGMALKAMVNSRGSWIDVTPAQEAQVDHVPEKEERGIQRDVERFVAKASGRTKKHVPRETHVVRIPAAASDGYYRLVVCGGDDAKKVLCECTVFRIASLSTDAAVVRGASLTTMPLEMGIKVATTFGTQVVKKYTGVAGAVVQSQTGKIVAKQSVKKATTVAMKGYHGFGGPGIQGAVQDSWRRQRAAGPVLVAGYTQELICEIIGSDEGPEKPFPIKFEGRISRGSGRSRADLGFPTANLADVPDYIKAQLSGVFAAWAMILPGRNIPDGLSPDWHPAVVTIAPPRGVQPTVVMLNSVSVHILQDFNDIPFFECKLKVLLMGWLHPPAQLTAPAAELMAQHQLDINTTMASLERENWLPQETITRMKTLKSERSFSDRLDDMTGSVAQRVDRIPLHLAGVRSESGNLRDQSYGIGGMWIRRD